MAFAHANAPETQAGFTQAGTYVLRLSVTDSDLTVIDEMTVVVTGSPGHKKATCQGASGLLQVGPGSDDVLIGTREVDVIRGERGNDLVLGRSGADCLVGGAGKDRLRGQAGADRLDPGRGKDTAIGGGGNDVIVSVDGKRDVVRCGGGHDRVTVDKRDRVAASCERVVVRPIGGSVTSRRVAGVVALVTAVVGVALVIAGLTPRSRPRAPADRRSRKTARDRRRDRRHLGRTSKTSGTTRAGVEDRVTGPLLPSAVPVSIGIPRLRVSSRLEDLGVDDDGVMEVPAEPANAGWYELGPSPGALGPGRRGRPCHLEPGAGGLLQAGGAATG